ncbi:hypothetical protein AB0M95_27435 [Sphaerisporangium sp. NPDC051017]|uniref:hypothetical protein n=1 Tax=Sphaerisporangium sp. NPDC051017 TaxID=3154636 RepID=UPI0034423AEB
MLMGSLPRPGAPTPFWAHRFLACFRDQAERKPGSSAAQAVRGGIADRIAANPLGGSGRS